MESISEVLKFSKLNFNLHAQRVFSMRMNEGGGGEPVFAKGVRYCGSKIPSLAPASPDTFDRKLSMISGLNVEEA